VHRPAGLPTITYFPLNQFYAAIKIGFNEKPQHQFSHEQPRRNVRDRGNTYSNAMLRTPMSEMDSKYIPGQRSTGKLNSCRQRTQLQGPGPRRTSSGLHPPPSFACVDIHAKCLAVCGTMYDRSPVFSLPSQGTIPFPIATS
jgi:hypothetical protein